MEEFRAQAAELDRADELASLRSRFEFPESVAEDCIYFTGNSLGLMPSEVRSAFMEELDDWARWGVEGHFHARKPWYSYHEALMAPAAAIVGAKPEEVVHMHGLTANIHLLMVSFYRPSAKRFKILCEAKAFPSDQYALQSQVRYHGFDPAEALVEVAPRPGEELIREEDILETIAQQGDSLALVFLGGVNYYSGQYFDLAAITAAAHAVGAVAGFDLAHAAGNVPLQLHNWQVDFAAWCTYKYLNSGPGSVGGIFVHQKHATSFDLPRFAGWWGHSKDSRFAMQATFMPMAGAEGWQLSNAPVMNMVAHRVSLAIFMEAGMERLRAKSVRLTAFLERAVQHAASSSGARLQIITPAAAERRGCQLSIVVEGYGKKLFERLQRYGVVADWREPNVIRVAPVPLYNSFEDCYTFGRVLNLALKEENRHG